MVDFPSHAPSNYVCPICLGIEGVESENTLLKKADLIYDDGLVCAFINSFWVGLNKGHVIVVPRKHFENLYEIPAEVGHRIFEVSQKIGIAMKKAYRCNGITLRQNNEPAGDQHAFHYHLHIFPRYENDGFNQKAAEGRELSDPEDRVIYAQKLKLELN
ncbi:MAG TPA: HIT family protein [Patescibacteria group bacterium]